MSKLTTEEYVRDKRFEVIGVAVQVSADCQTGNNYHKARILDTATIPVWFSGSKTKVKKFLDGFDWANSTVVAHNAMFDIAILNWHFGT